MIVNVNPVADDPNLKVRGNIVGDEDSGRDSAGNVVSSISEGKPIPLPLRYEIADKSETISINVKLTDSNGSLVSGAELVTISGSTVTSLGSITSEGINASSNLMSLHLVPPNDFSGQLLAKLTPTITDGSISTAFSEQTISVTIIDRADPIEFSNFAENVRNYKISYGFPIK